jgi:crotonobetainyl-CoA:carnitine CoA-transferase CaiB-like acyl-CoA transferase
VTALPAQSSHALDDVKVLEYAEMLSGPMCGKMFAGMGAQVIKIESPNGGDPIRRHPPFAGDEAHPEKSGSFLYLNTGKHSLTLNPAAPTGASIFRRLAAEADILIENHPPGFMANLGLGYDTLNELNPRLIMVSISPFGQTGPYRDWKGSDLIEYAMSLTGYNTPTMVADVEMENPLRAPGHAAEMMGAANAAAAAMFALFNREATGVGDWIDVPCWQAVVNTAKLEMAPLTYLNTPFSRERAKSSGGMEPLPCKDGYIYTLWAADAHWIALKKLLGNPPEFDSNLFDDLAGRHQYDDALRPMIREQLLKYETEYLVTEGQRLGLTIGPVYTVAQAANHPHLRARDAFVTIGHPIAGRFQYPRALVQMTGTPPISERAPLLGEHNRAILSRLGYSIEDQQALRAAGVI